MRSPEKDKEKPSRPLPTVQLKPRDLHRRCNEGSRLLAPFPATSLKEIKFFSFKNGMSPTSHICGDPWYHKKIPFPYIFFYLWNSQSSRKLYVNRFLDSSIGKSNLMIHLDWKNFIALKVHFIRLLPKLMVSMGIYIFQSMYVLVVLYC